MFLRPPSNRFSLSPRFVLVFNEFVPWQLKVFPITIGLGVFLILVSGSWRQVVAQSENPQSTESNSQPSSSQILFVNPMMGNNVSGDGSQRSPFRTITHALQVAQPNTVIMLAPGTYSADSGEAFPIVMKPNVTIQGDPSRHGRGFVIRGGGTFLSPTSAGQNVTLLGADQGQLLGVTVTNPNPRGYGLWVESSNPVVRGNTFTGNTHDGISTVGNSAPLIQDNLFTQNGANGITIFGRSQPEVRQNAFEQTGFGINVAENAAPLLVENQVSQNRIGVLVQGNAQPTLRGNRIEANREDGLTAISNSQPNLGTNHDPGNNVFANNPVDLNANATSQAIPAFGNQLAGDRLQGEVDLAGTTPLSPPASPAANRFATNPATAAPNAIAELPPASAPPAPSITELPPAAAANRATPSPSTQVSTSRRQTPTPAPTATQPSSSTAAAIVSPPDSSFASAASTATIEISVPPPAPLPQTSTSRPSATRSQRTATSRPTPASRPAALPAPAPTPAAIVPASAPTAQLVSTAQPTHLQVPIAQPRSSFNAPINIPVPPPESSQTAPVAIASRNLPAPPRGQSPQADVLPVPDANIPLGNIGGLPTVNVSRNVAFRAGGGGGSTVSYHAANLRYRVVVDASDEHNQSRVQAIIPAAFRTSINGRSLLQVGAFSNRDNAEQTVQMLSQNGVRAVIQEIE
jgi:parallel beta-helix repeat protein